MIAEKDLKQIIEQVLREMGTEGQTPEAAQQMQDRVSAQILSGSSASSNQVEAFSDSELVDITATRIQDELFVPNPVNREEYMKYKQKTPARVGVFRAGPRYRTNTMLRFRADHAVAMDAVFNLVSEDFLKEMNLFSVQTEINDKDHYLTRPDLGKIITAEGVEKIKANCKKKPRVQVYVSDGLSSTAIEANVADTLPALVQGLESHKIDVGTPFFVKYGRVGAMDHISELVEAECTVVLIGERPGLATGESMSCYITYGAYVGIPEAKRTVVSNIHKNGTPAAEAGAHIAEIVKKVLDAKLSGVELKL